MALFFFICLHQSGFLCLIIVVILIFLVFSMLKEMPASLLTMLFGLDLFLYGFFEVKELPSVTVYRDYLH